jgi:hypothetical protein
MTLLLTSTALAALLAVYMINGGDDSLDARGSPGFALIPDDDQAIISVARRLLRSPWTEWKGILDGIPTEVDRKRVLHAAALLAEDAKTRNLIYRLIDDYRGPKRP